MSRDGKNLKPRAAKRNLVIFVFSYINALSRYYVLFFINVRFTILNLK